MGDTRAKYGHRTAVRLTPGSRRVPDRLPDLRLRAARRGRAITLFQRSGPARLDRAPAARPFDRAASPGCGGSSSGAALFGLLFFGRFVSTLRRAVAARQVRGIANDPDVRAPGRRRSPRRRRQPLPTRASSRRASPPLQVARATPPQRAEAAGQATARDADHERLRLGADHHRLPPHLRERRQDRRVHGGRLAGVRARSTCCAATTPSHRGSCTSRAAPAGSSRSSCAATTSCERCSRPSRRCRRVWHKLTTVTSHTVRVPRPVWRLPGARRAVLRGLLAPGCDADRPRASTSSCSTCSGLPRPEPRHPLRAADARRPRADRACALPHRPAQRRGLPRRPAPAGLAGDGQRITERGRAAAHRPDGAHRLLPEGRLRQRQQPGPPGVATQRHPPRARQRCSPVSPSGLGFTDRREWRERRCSGDAGERIDDLHRGAHRCRFLDHVASPADAGGRLAVPHGDDPERPWRLLFGDPEHPLVGVLVHAVIRRDRPPSRPLPPAPRPRRAPTDRRRGEQSAERSTQPGAPPRPNGVRTVRPGWPAAATPRSPARRLLGGDDVAAPRPAADQQVASAELPALEQLRRTRRSPRPPVTRRNRGASRSARIGHVAGRRRPRSGTPGGRARGRVGSAMAGNVTEPLARCAPRRTAGARIDERAERANARAAGAER